MESFATALTAARPVPSRDEFGDRMKGYEKAYRTYLPSKSWACLRLDGRGFSKWTRGLERPYDLRLVEAMAEVTLAVCEDLSGAVLGYTQSDEITIIFSDLGSEEAQMMFGGSVMKLCSVTASLASAKLARIFSERALPQFDARVFALPDETEVCNCLKWRSDDCSRNAVSAIASHYFSPKQLHGKSTQQRRDMLAEAGVDLSQEDPRFMFGQLFYREERMGQVEYTHKKTGEKLLSPPALRRFWETRPAPRFTADPEGETRKLLIP